MKRGQGRIVELMMMFQKRKFIIDAAQKVAHTHREGDLARSLRRFILLYSLHFICPH